jgi:allophanate hydrolase subunit 1
MRGVASGRRWKKCVVEADLLGLGNTQTGVTTVTDRTGYMGETSIVNMVQRASKKVLLEPGDTRQQWKGEAATSFVS